MKKFLMSSVFVLMFAATSFAFMQKSFDGHQPLTSALHKTGIKIIDIRTMPEWRQTGIVKGSYTLTFFDEKGNYNAKKFIQDISKVVSPSETFAIICRSGNRTTAVSKFLREVGFNRVINLKGGIKRAIKNRVDIEPYKG